MLQKIQENINPIHLASLSDNIPSGYRNPGYELQQNPNKSVLLIKGKEQIVGLYTLLIAKSMGAIRVDYVKNIAEQLIVAKTGVDNIFFLRNINDKYDTIVEASST